MDSQFFDNTPTMRINARQAASSLVQLTWLAHAYGPEDQVEYGVPIFVAHFHDASGYEIAWNNVMAIRMWNEVRNDTLQVPLKATEGYNQHGHTGPYDGGWIPGRGVHDHRDNANGGFCFAVLHPGTALPQQPWAI